MEFESFFNKILNFYEVKSVTDLAEKLNVTRSTVSGWKNRQASGAILEYLFNNDLKALHFIFGNEKINNFQNSKNALAQAFGGKNTNNYNENIQSDNVEIDKNILKLVDTLYSFAKDNNKIDELKTDLSSLLPKYM
mgnify:FL=1